MKNLFKMLAGLAVFGIYSISFGATSTVDHFEISSPSKTANVSEAIDLTITAVDKSGNAVKDYVGKILIFSQTDPTAEMPASLSDNTYTFKASDGGVVTFQKAIKFSKQGTQDINVYDMSNENVYGSLEIQVGNTTATTSTTTTTSSGSDAISIKFPENGSTVGTKTVKANGTTSKNHKVVLTLNTNKTYNTISDANGLFEVELTDVVNGQNSLKADVLDADGKVISSSSQVLFTIASQAPSFKSITLDGTGEYTTEQIVGVTVIAEKGLQSANVTINDQVFPLTEGTAGTYTGTITLPKEEGNYKIDVALKNELGVDFKQSGATEVTVKTQELQVAQPQVNCDDFKKELVIKNIKLVKLKTKSILSWDKLDKATSYNIYKKDSVTSEMVLLQNITDTSYEIEMTGSTVEYSDFAVKAVFKDDVCNVESDNYSDMTKVQTGPKEIAILLISMITAGGLYFYRRKNLKNV